MQAEAARMAVVSRDVIHKATLRGSVPRDHGIRDAVARLFDVSEQWLWFGAPDHERSRQQNKKDGVAPAPVPVVDTPQPSSQYKPDPRGHFVIVESDDFQPVAMRGDVLWVTPSFPVRVGERAYIVMADGSEIVGVLKSTTNTAHNVTVGSGVEALKIKDVSRLERISAITV
jgi:hypothetical protein